MDKVYLIKSGIPASTGGTELLYHMGEKFGREFNLTVWRIVECTAKLNIFAGCHCICCGRGKESVL